MYGEPLTPTQRAAYERSRAFHNRIATRAQELKVAIEAPVPKIVELKPTLEVEQPRKEPWFSIVKEIEPASSHPSIAKIQEVICDHFNLTKNDLKSACREWRISQPRMIAVYLCRELTPKSLPEIGRRFGGRDHSTALHSHRKISARVASDGEFAGLIAKLRERLA